MSDEQKNERPPLSKEEKRKVEKHLKEVRKQLRKNLVKAYHGWWYWRTTLKKYKKLYKNKNDINRTAVVLMPEVNDRDNYFALRYLEQMLKQHKFIKAIILTDSEMVEKSASLFSKNIHAIVRCPRKNAEELMQFYCLYNFDKRFFCASLDEPYGRNGSRIVGTRGITAEEIFVIGVYRVYPYTRLSAPDYKKPKTSQIILRSVEQEPLTDDDMKILEFLKQGETADDEAAKNPPEEPISYTAKIVSGS
ncbi:MAG: hypothetical protein LBS62_05335 [Clostridiales bacterium]|jgi:hypothetical protein|nr:hypothetical protein [Clostridiales bacterium]